MGKECRQNREPASPFPNFFIFHFFFIRKEFVRNKIRRLTNKITNNRNKMESVTTKRTEGRLVDLRNELLVVVVEHSAVQPTFQLSRKSSVDI